MEKLSKDEVIKAEILKGGQKLFQQYGLNKTTMEDIAKSIGKGKSTLYYYFKSKEEIFQEVIEMEMQHVFEATEKAVENATTAPEKLKAYAITKIRESRTRKNLYNIIRLELPNSFQLVFELRKKFSTREFNIVRNILEIGVKHKECMNLQDGDLDIIASVIVSALRGVEVDLAIENNYPNLETRYEVITAVLLNGLKPQC